MSSVLQEEEGRKDRGAFNESKYRKTPNTRKYPQERRWENWGATAGTRRGFALSKEVSVRSLW